MKKLRKRNDPRGNAYYWLTGRLIHESLDEDIDMEAIRNNYISITPLHYDLTSYEMLESFRQWGFENEFYGL